jgi:nucleotide-binding universal stress UspA family protein
MRRRARLAPYPLGSRPHLAKGTSFASVVGMSSTEPSSTVRNVILVAIDMSPETKPVIAWAAQFARRTPGAELHIVHALDPRTAIQEEANGPLVYDAILATHAQFLEEHVRTAGTEAGVTVVGHLVEEGAERAILQTAASIDADTIVLGTHGRHGLARWVMGSIAEAVVRNATCAVSVIRDKQHSLPQMERIEPPCPACLETQRASGGAALWCERHGKHHPRAHLHYSSSGGFGAGSSLIQP